MSLYKSSFILMANIKPSTQKSTKRNITSEGIGNPPSKCLPGKTQSYDLLRAHPYFQSLHHRVRRRVVCGGTRTPTNSIRTSKMYVVKIKWQSASERSGWTSVKKSFLFFWKERSWRVYNRTGSALFCWMYLLFVFTTRQNDFSHAS